MMARSSFVYGAGESIERLEYAVLLTRRGSFALCERSQDRATRRRRSKPNSRELIKNVPHPRIGLQAQWDGVRSGGAKWRR
jgi:hypothetical protein